MVEFHVWGAQNELPLVIKKAVQLIANGATSLNMEVAVRLVEKGYKPKLEK